VSYVYNPYQQPVGTAMDEWQGSQMPERVTLAGQYCRLEPLDALRHGPQLWAAWQTAPDDRGWTYLSIGPFADYPAFESYLTQAALSPDPFHFAVIDEASSRAVGTLSLMRIDPKNGVVEVGFVVFSPLLQRTVQATEAHFLLMKYAFDTLGYRRYEWKCDRLNAPSYQAAQRLGFRFEGLFRNAIVYKQRTRDTAWFSIIDRDWPQIKAGFEGWLAEDNLVDGQQKQSLATLREMAWPRDESRLNHYQLRRLTAEDSQQWQSLWQGYLNFYQQVLSPDTTHLCWQRLIDPLVPIHGLGLFDEQGEMLGFAHYVYHYSSGSPTQYCYLEDLFTRPDARGKGVATRLINAVRQQAESDNCTRLYWHTHESNHQAQRLYDTLAKRSGFIEYRQAL